MDNVDNEIVSATGITPPPILKSNNKSRLGSRSDTPRCGHRWRLLAIGSRWMGSGTSSTTSTAILNRKIVVRSPIESKVRLPVGAWLFALTLTLIFSHSLSLTASALTPHVGAATTPLLLSLAVSSRYNKYWPLYKLLSFYIFSELHTTPQISSIYTQLQPPASRRNIKV